MDPCLVWCGAQWSPWTAMPDCYKNFCCVENAKFGSAAVVQPGDSWRATQDFAVVDLDQP
jgi:glucose-6-phosphate 1-epimerase